MSLSCDYCDGPLAGAGLAGRPWPGRPAAAYCCYGCLSLGEQRRQDDATPDSGGWAAGGLGARLAAGLIVAGQSMIFGLALNLHDDIPPAVRAFTQTVLLGGALVVLALLGGPLVRAAWGELRRGRLTTEALFLLTLGGALAASVRALLTGRGAVYFEVVSVVLVVHALGKVVGARTRAAAVAGSRAWAGQLCSCRLVDEKGRTRTVPVTEVLPGDVAEVHPGETIPVDGVIHTGTGFVSEAVVTGVPFAVVRRPGDRVLAGAASHDATFRVTATAAGTERQVDHLLAAVEAARDTTLSLQHRADRIAAAFFPVLVAAALGTFGYWAFLSPAGWEAGLLNAMSVLLVACPCALGLATPVIVWAAVGRLAERGVIVRAGDAVERLAGVDRVLFDKTGTLTEDRFTLVDISTTATGAERAGLLGWVSLVEAQCRHPIAKPFADLPRPFPAGAEPRVASLAVVPGCGVNAVIEEASGATHALRIGRAEWVEEPNPPTPFPRKEGGAGTTVAVAVDGELAAVAVVAERFRDSVPAALADFARLGLTVEVLTGDAGGRLPQGMAPARAGMLPADKREYVERVTAAGGKTLMVGDGINDAAALAAAHVGVALASGTDLAVGAAAVTLYHGDLRALPWAVELSRAAVRAVRRNLYRALAYNVVGVALAAGGVLHPVAAALLMVASSLSLLIASTRVGVGRDHCAEPVPRPRRVTARAAVHFAALALQGVVVLLLLEGARGPIPAAAVLASFTVIGGLLAVAWHRRPELPHALDMAFGMLTLGNLGMLLGWWADNGFAPLHDGGCPACAAASRGGMLAPWMWAGMLASANAAMLWLGRRPLPRGDHAAAMFTGGNVGMVVGMLLGGRVAGEVATDSVAGAAAAGFAGMTAGMLAGMVVGTWLAERLFAGVRAVVTPAASTATHTGG